MINKTALVLLSGGQDSTTCLFWAKREFALVEAIGFYYGQRHRVELECAYDIARAEGIPFMTYNLSGLLSHSSLVNHDENTNAVHTLNPELPSSFTPGRNALFLTLAASYAYTKGITDLVTGVCQTDYSGYPDCRDSFIRCQAKAVSLALDTEMRIHTPLMNLTKAETWKLAAELGCVETIRLKTHTDYNGDHTTLNEWGYGKLDNPASVLRAKGYEEAKAKGWV
jgi:7-cyano-7-deazaguanine synthase